MNDAAPEALYRWLAEQAASSAPPADLMSGFCDRLVAMGLPLLRGLATFESLDPTVEAFGLFWRRSGADAWRENFPRAEDASFEPEGWLKSPLYQLYHGHGMRLRRRLDRPGAADEFPVFADLVAMGGTEYLAIKAPFRGHGAGSGVMSSWTTDRPGGFTEADEALLEATLPGLNHALQTTVLGESVETLLGCYLGRDAAERVLQGAVGRGVAHTLDAILWTSDLAGFTRLADTEPRDRVIEFLNAYAERACDAIEAAGGEILKFTGDGILAVFDRACLEDAPTRALDAAAKALDTTAALTVDRLEAGRPVSRLRIALHCGEVFYGNVGSRTRLDFTVVGPAVNEAARLCELSKSVDRDLVLSSAFHDCAGAQQGQLVALGRFALRGVRRPEMLYTLDALP